MTPLRQRMLEDLRVRNYSPKTQQIYVDHVVRFARHFGRSPDELGLEEIRTYQVHLIQDKKASWSSFNQAVCALRFLYRTTLKQAGTVEQIPFPKQPKRLPTVLSPEEIATLLRAVSNPNRAREAASFNRLFPEPPPGPYRRVEHRCRRLRKQSLTLGVLTQVSWNKSLLCHCWHWSHRGRLGGQQMNLKKMYTSLLTADLAAAEGWYTKLLGRTPDHRPMDTLVQWEVFDHGGLMLSSSDEIAGKGVMFLYVDDLAAERRRLQGLGMALGDDITGDYSTLAQLRDPDGNLVTLATPPARSFPRA